MRETDAHRESRLRRLAEQRIDQSKTAIRGTDLTVRMGTATMGAVMHGAPGGHEGSMSQIAAHPVAAELALDMCIDEDLAYEVLRVLGRLLQKRLLDGHPCGIPFVGVLHVRQQYQSPEMLKKRRDRARADLARWQDVKARGGRGWKTLSVDGHIAAAKTRLGRAQPFVNKIALTQPTSLRRMYSDNCVYHNAVREMVHAIWEQRVAQRKRARERVGGVRGPTAHNHMSRRNKLALQGRPRLGDRYERPTEAVRDRYTVA